MTILSSIIGWTHILSATASLVLGAVVLVGNKGSLRHVMIGRWYVYAMLVNNMSALWIYTAFGKWFFPHTLAVVALAIIIPGYLITRVKHYRHWLKIHIWCMVLSYYLLVGGAINETFLRIPALKSPPYYSMRGLIHFGNELAFLGLIIFFMVKYKRFRQVAD